MGGKFEPMYECMYQLLKANLLKNKKMGVNASSKSWNSTYIYIYIYICNLSIQKRYYNGILIPCGKMKKTRKAKSINEIKESHWEKGATDVTIRRREREREGQGERERDGDIKMSSKRVLNKRHLFILLLSLSSCFLLLKIHCNKKKKEDGLLYRLLSIAL